MNSASGSCRTQSSAPVWISSTEEDQQVRCTEELSSSPNALKKSEELKEASRRNKLDAKTSGSLQHPKSKRNEQNESDNDRIRNCTQVPPPQ